MTGSNTATTVCVITLSSNVNIPYFVTSESYRRPIGRIFRPQCDKLHKAYESFVRRAVQDGCRVGSRATKHEPVRGHTEQSSERSTNSATLA